MSYSMSPPQKPAPSPYPPSSYGQPTGSPNNTSSFAPPPAKRQRLSPDPHSPQRAVNGGYSYPQPHGLSNAGNYGNPYAPSLRPPQAHSPYSPASYTASPQSSFNTPEPYRPSQQPGVWPQQQQRPAQASSPLRSSEMMPPPPRPNKEEKEGKESVDDINDALFSSGINLKDEENYLHNVYNNRIPLQDSSFASTNQTTSFGSATLSTNTSFSLLTQPTSLNAARAPDGAFAGTFGAPLSQEEISNEQKRKREAAARAKADRDQHHLNNPFLLGNVLRTRLDRIAREQHVRLDVQGLYVRQPETETHVMASADGKEGIVATVQAGSKVDQGAAFADVLSLVSLAAGERCRGLVEEAWRVARARKYGDHGRVPPEFADLAVGEGRVRSVRILPESVTGTQWDRVPDDSGELTNGEEAERERVSTPLRTLEFEGTLTKHLLSLASRDRAAEKARLRKRAARRAFAAEQGGTGATDAAAATTPEAASNEPLVADGQLAPQTKLSKKEISRQQREAKNSSEAQMQASTNQTAALMALGKRGGKYSWMSGGVAGMPVNRFAKPTAAAAGVDSAETTAVGSVKVEGNDGEGGVEKVGIVGGGEEWGNWREDGVGGEGLQIRDWVAVLERDGREGRALQRVLNRLV